MGFTRWPADLSVIAPRSRCPRCERQITALDNIPIASWLVLRGRCRCCDESISALYPTVEFVVGLGWMLSVSYFGVTFTALRVAVFGTILLGIAMTDLREYLIPDGFTLTGLAWTMLTAVGLYLISPGYTDGVFVGPYEALIGACVGAGIVAIVGWLAEIAMRREAMGLGDVTLMAFAGAALGPSRAIVTVFVAAALATATFALVVAPVMWMRRGRGQLQTELALGAAPMSLPPVPFGVFLAPAALVTLLWGDALLRWLQIGG